MNAISEYKRAPTARLIIAIAVAAALFVPLVAVWVLVAGREEQSTVAAESIAAGWGGAQTVSGPVLVVPYRVVRQDRSGGDVTAWETRVIAPERFDLATDLIPERRTRSIYEVIVYEAALRGRARFVMPADLARQGIDPAAFDFSRAELRFVVSDAGGLSGNPEVSVGGAALRLQPGTGGGNGAAGSGFFAWLDASSLATAPIQVDFALNLRGNGSIALVPEAGDTRWTVNSSWPHPSFLGRFLPSSREINSEGFSAQYRIGNLALGRSLIGLDAPRHQTDAAGNPAAQAPPAAQIALVKPVDLYDQVGRATRYGFLFIGFTFLALLLFDIVGGARVRAAEYLLVGVGLILFFVLLLAFAEVIGFELAYLVASGAITLLIGLYSAAVLASRKRAGLIGGLIAILSAILYLLLSLEAFSLLIGAVLLFFTLAGVMYLTRNLNWGGGEEEMAA